MRPTFMGFETAKSSIFTNQKALDIVGNNLANIDTNGYTRQRVETASISPSSYTSRVSSNRIGLSGQGVETLGVSQMRDSFLDKRFRDTYSSTSYHGKAGDILADIQGALGDGSDISSSVLKGGIEQLYKSLDNFLSDSVSSTQSNLVMSAFRNMTQLLQQLDTKLTNVYKQQAYDMGLDVERINDITEQIVNLNDKISTDNSVLSDPSNEHYRPNELYDQRNLLLDELSAYGDINVTQLANGMVNVTFAGKPLVTGLHSDSLVKMDNEDNTVSLNWRSSGESVIPTAGTLKACLEFINGRGSNVQNTTESPQQGIPYYRDRLNTFAQALANVANSKIPEQTDSSGKPVVYDYKGNAMVYTEGTDKWKCNFTALEDDLEIKDENGVVTDTIPKGSYVDANDPTKVLFRKEADGTYSDPKNPGVVVKDPVFEVRYKVLLSTGSDTNDYGHVTAGNISLSKAWNDGGSGYFITNKDVFTPNYAQELQNALTGKDTTFISYGEKYVGTFETYIDDYTSKLGTDLNFQTGRQESTGKVADDFISRRDEISGVSRDEETANMLMYQKSYEAAARMMTTLDDLLDVVINRMGRAGL